MRRRTMKTTNHQNPSRAYGGNACEDPSSCGDEVPSWGPWGKEDDEDGDGSEGEDPSSWDPWDPSDGP